MFKICKQCGIEWNPSIGGDGCPACAKAQQGPAAGQTQPPAPGLPAPLTLEMTATRAMLALEHQATTHRVLAERLLARDDCDEIGFVLSLSPAERVLLKAAWQDKTRRDNLMELVRAAIQPQPDKAPDKTPPPAGQVPVAVPEPRSEKVDMVRPGPVAEAPQPAKGPKAEPPQAAEAPRVVEMVADEPPPPPDPAVVEAQRQVAEAQRKLEEAKHHQAPAGG